MKTPAVLAGSLVVLVAAYTGTAWYVGMEAEKTIKIAVERANQRIDKTLVPGTGSAQASIAIEDYKRGIFSSQARYTLVLQDDDSRTELALQDHMQHGPFPWGLVQQGNFAPQLAYSRSQLVDTEVVKRWFDAARGAMPLHADTRIGFGGQGMTTWQFAPLEWAADDSMLSFSGGQMVVHLSNDFRDSRAQGSFASLVMGGAAQSGDTVALKNIGLETHTRSASDEALQLNSRLQIEQVALETESSESLHLDQVSIVIDSDQKGALLDAALQYDIQGIKVGEIDLGRLTLGGKLKQFNFEAFSALMAEYDAIAREHGAEDGEDFDLRPEDETRLLAHLVPLLAASPEVELAPVSWSNEEGKTALSLNMVFQPLPENDPQAQQQALEEALRALHFELSLSRPMLLQVVARAAGGGEDGRQFEMFAALIYDSYIAQLQQQGLMRVDGDNALLAVDYKDGVLTVNGEEKSIEELMILLAELGI